MVEGAGIHGQGAFIATESWFFMKSALHETVITQLLRMAIVPFPGQTSARDAV
jgi:hypothetical protein